jgi:hypothetical protein
MVVERPGVRQRGLMTEELQAPRVVCRGELLQEQPAEQPRENPDRKKEPGVASDPAPAIRRDATARHDDVDVWVVGQRRAPGMEHGGQSDPGAKMLGVGSDGDERPGRHPEQQVVDDRLVLPGDGGDRPRQAKHDVEVGNRQQLRFPIGEPRSGECPRKSAKFLTTRM